jgi:hypothetical protein
MRRIDEPAACGHEGIRVELRASRRALLGAAAAGAIALVRPGGLAAQGWGHRSLQASGVATFPAHDTWTASPETEISFRGVTAEELGPVQVVGSVTGGRTGILEPHGDGDGVSYLPDASFAPGEVVTVTADVALSPATGGALTFGVVRPLGVVRTPAEREDAAPTEAPRRFQSRPDLFPPRMEITTPASDTADGLVFLTTKVPDGQNGLTILDNEGELVWYGVPALPIDMQFDLSVQEYQGQPVLTWAEAAMTVGYGFGHFVIADRSYQPIAEFGVGNGFPGGDVHEFLLTSRGTALVIIYHPVEWDASSIGGSRYGKVLDNIVQEIEIETGRVLFEWHSLDHIALDEALNRFDVSSDNPYDYFHLNSVGETPDGALVISARHTFAIYKLDRRTGEVIWRLNGSKSDFTMGEGTKFAWQHDARIHDNGELTLFDNHEADQEKAPEAHSRGMVLDLDEEAMTATLVREYVHPTEVLSTSQGNMQILPNGNVFIGWGSAPVFSEFSRDGELIFNGRFPLNHSSYRAYRFPWVGQPTEPPDLAVRVVGTESQVYASWNGATEVASWRVIAGPAPEQMEAVGEAERDGFETSIRVDTVAEWYSVQALDAGGAIIGTAVAIQPGT